MNNKQEIQNGCLNILVNKSVIAINSIEHMLHIRDCEIVLSSHCMLLPFPDCKNTTEFAHKASCVRRQMGIELKRMVSEIRILTIHGIYSELLYIYKWALTSMQTFIRIRMVYMHTRIKGVTYTLLNNIIY